MIGRLDTTKREATVVGAGIAGLLAAHALDRAGYRVTLLEAQPRAGGLIQTRRTEFGIAEAAAHSLLATPAVEEFCAELGVELAEVREDSRARYVCRDGRPRKFPLTFAETLGALGRAAFARACEDAAAQDLGAWGRRHLGAGAHDYLLTPFVRGVYGAQPADLGVAAAFPELSLSPGATLLGTMLGKALKRRASKDTRDTTNATAASDATQTSATAASNSTQTNESATNGDGRVNGDGRANGVNGAGGAGGKGSAGRRKKRMVAPAKGMGDLVGRLERRLEERLGGRFRRATSVAEIPDAPNVLLCVPAGAAASLIGASAPALSVALRGVRYTPIVSVTAFVARESFTRPVKGVGVLVPEREGRKCLGVLFNSSSYAGRVFDETRCASFTVLLGGTAAPGWATAPDSEIASAVGGELDALLGVRGRPLELVINRWPRAIPQYSVELPRLWRLAAETWCAAPGRVLFGNYTGQVSLRGMIEGAASLA